MKKIIAFAGSNSSKSINKSFLKSLKDDFKGNDFEIIDIEKLEIPIFSIDIEENTGMPEDIQKLDSIIQKSDGIIISVSEHNGNISAFFKNILDWLSRNNRAFLENKNILLYSISPGGGGAKSALEITAKTLPYFKGKVIDKKNIGNFYKLMENGKIIDNKISMEVQKQITHFLKII